MSQDSPAAILFDELGNPVGVIFNGIVYRLQTETTITDGTNGPVAVKPPNVAAIASDPALVVALSPNNAVTIGSVNQGSPNTLNNAWPVEITDGYNVLGTIANPLQVNVDGYVQTNPHVIVDNFPSQQHIIVDGYVQTNPVVIQGTSPWIVNVNNFPADQHVIVDGYVQTNPHVIVDNFPAQQHVIVDGYVQTNPNVIITNFPVDQHVIVDGYVQTNPVVIQGTSPWTVNGTVNVGNFPAQQHIIVDGYVQTNPNVVVSNFPAQQHVVVDGYVQTNPNVIASGTVTANQGSANTLSNGWPVKLTDGNNVLGTVANPLQVNVDGYVQTNPVVIQGTSPWMTALSNQQQLILTNSNVTTSGSAVFTNIGNKEVNLIINVTGSVTGTTPTLTFSINEVDPQNTNTIIGTSVTGTAIVAAGTQTLKLADTITGAVKIIWTIGGTSSPTFNGTYATLSIKPTEDVIEQFAPVAEDNVNGVIGIAIKPLAVSTYSTSFTSGVGALPANIKASAGNVFSIYALNSNTAQRYLQLFNSTAVPSGTPLVSFLIPALGSITIDSGFFTSSGINFSTGITLGISLAQATYTAATAGDHNYAICWK